MRRANLIVRQLLDLQCPNCFPELQTWTEKFAYYTKFVGDNQVYEETRPLEFSLTCDGCGTKIEGTMVIDARSIAEAVGVL